MRYSLLVALLVFGCSPDYKRSSPPPAAAPSGAAVDALRAAGYSKILSLETAVLGCGRDDSMLTSKHFTAQTADGRIVKGTVCCGGPLSFKGCTIRF